MSVEGYLTIYTKYITRPCMSVEGYLTIYTKESHAVALIITEDSSEPFWTKVSTIIESGSTYFHLIGKYIKNLPQSDKENFSPHFAKTNIIMYEGNKKNKIKKRYSAIICNTDYDKNDGNFSRFILMTLLICGSP